MARPALVFACAHLCDERLFAAQIDALGADFDCRVFAFREHDSLAAMAGGAARRRARALHADRPVARRLPRVRGDAPGAGARRAPRACSTRRPRPTREARRAGRLADIATVEAGGIDALIPQLPGRWLLPAHQQRDDLTALMASMARSIGANGQRNQQRAMLGRPESLADLAAVRVPTLVLCGAGDAVTPLADHEAIAARIAGARLVVVPDSGHLSTIEQPAAVTAALSTWLAETPTRSP